MVSVGALSEDVDLLVGPTAGDGGQFEERAAPSAAGTLGGAQHCSSIDTASRVHDQAGNGISRRSVDEGAEHLLGPVTLRVGLQLEHNAVSPAAPLGRRAVKIASGIEDQVTIGIFSIVPTLEGMQNTLRPSAGARCQFEDDAVSRTASRVGRAIEISSCVKGEAIVGRGPVGCSLEGVDDGFGPTAGAFG